MDEKNFNEKEIGRISYLIKKITKGDYTFIADDFKKISKEEALLKLNEELEFFKKKVETCS